VVQFSWYLLSGGSGGAAVVPGGAAMRRQLRLRPAKRCSALFKMAGGDSLTDRRQTVKKARQIQNRPRPKNRRRRQANFQRLSSEHQSI